MLRTLLLLTLLLPTSLSAQSSTQDKVRNYRRTNEHQIVNEFLSLLAIPNIASDNPNIRKNAEAIVEMMKRRGLSPRLLEARTPNVPPVVYGEFKTSGAQRTLVLYAHYDGQPTDPKQWTGTLPWQPVFRSAALEAGGQVLPSPLDEQALNPEWRIYARSASDDKAGVVSILNAFDALKASSIALTSNIKFVFEGEEEAGSSHLGEIIKLNKDLLEGDSWIICDGPVHQSGVKQVVFGARGDVNVDVTVYGAKRPLHSGHYGNWAPNPAMLLAQLLASMKDADGRVMIDGWYSDVEPLGEAEHKAIADAPQYDEELKRQLGISRTEGGGKSLMELINVPSLNINGVSSGDVGALARNVIPTSASAVLDLRLVRGNDHDRQVQRLIDHIKKQGYFVVDHNPTDDERSKHPLLAKVLARSGGYNAERTRMDLPISLAVIDAVQSTLKDKVVLLPTSGGSLPLSVITDNLKTVTMSVPIANYDNNQHAENENIRLQNLWDGIETYAALMTMRK
ncbi:MAG TPA: M20/M25/M40 family metallo-hydrolase [Pyrinomonadaceae bacterium]|jgi:Acetylornithine deacetylase/Succinyl-diaminopimelate desuccinylase and related deacylases|nr:M20/M25/M40 family metallo-hydrolase [Pyrinomonadaceae bacterium]